MVAQPESLMARYLSLAGGWRRYSCAIADTVPRRGKANQPTARAEHKYPRSWVRLHGIAAIRLRPSGDDDAHSGLQNESGAHVQH
jgi:hypothetical protein